MGINRKAELLDHLQRRHKDFQKRMMVAAPASEPEHESPAGLASAAPASAIPRRKILGDSASFSSTSSIPSSTSGSQRNGLAAAASREDVFAASSASSSTRPNGRMQIFADPSGTEAEAASRSAWPELRTRKERVKENVRAPEKMEGAVLKQRGAAKAATKQAGARARAAPKIVPFRDPEPSAAASSSKIVPFRDPEPSGASRSTLADSKGIAKKSAGKAGIVPFVDDAKDVEKSVNTKPSAPPPTKFVPFKDPVSCCILMPQISTDYHVDFGAVACNFSVRLACSGFGYATEGLRQRRHIRSDQRGGGTEEGSFQELQR